MLKVNGLDLYLLDHVLTGSLLNNTDWYKTFLFSNGMGVICENLCGMGVIFENKVVVWELYVK